MITCTRKLYSCTQALKKGPSFQNMKTNGTLLNRRGQALVFNPAENYGSKQKKASFSFQNLEKTMVLSREEQVLVFKTWGKKTGSKQINI